jgi:hypothetical protein
MQMKTVARAVLVVCEPPGMMVARAAAALRRRVQATAGDRGALTLEWIVIAGILVAAAVAAGIIFRSDLVTWESKLTSGS